MIKQETLSNNSESKEMYIKPECEIYETELEGILCGSDPTNVGTTDVNSFLPGREYEGSVF